MDSRDSTTSRAPTRPSSVTGTYVRRWSASESEWCGATRERLADLSAIEYAQLGAYDEFTQPVGGIATLAGRPYPNSYDALGRSVTVDEVVLEEPETGARVKGRRIVVTVFDSRRVVASVETFRPEPAP